MLFLANHTLQQQQQQQLLRKQQQQQNNIGLYNFELKNQPIYASL